MQSFKFMSSSLCIPIRRKLVPVAPDTLISAVARKMKEEEVGAVVVITEEDGKPRGILTDRDIIVRCIAENIDVDECTAEQILSESPCTIRDDDGNYDEAISKMQEEEIHRLIVVDEKGRAIGLLAA
jgi:CBS domain-containing protein